MKGLKLVYFLGEKPDAIETEHRKCCIELLNVQEYNAINSSNAAWLKLKIIHQVFLISPILTGKQSIFLSHFVNDFKNLSKILLKINRLQRCYQN
jgi:hypothetical protein